MFKLIFVLLAVSGLTNATEFFFDTRVSDNSISEVGEACHLNDGRQGVCTEITACESAKRLLSAKRSLEIVHCAFRGKQPIVCCPQSPKFIKALCGKVSPILNLDFKITNGMRANVGEYPYQAALGRRDLEGAIKFNCGGSLIADDVVITAAHCMAKKTEAATMVRLGRTSLDLDDPDDDSTPVDIDIEAFRIHPKYSSRTKYHDIALLKLKQRAPESNNLKPICLAVDEKIVPSNLTITGYGATRFQASAKDAQSKWLLKGVVERLSDSDCKRTYKENAPSHIGVISEQVCANSMTGIDACQGDSGGALTFKKDGHFYQYGVISYGAGCGSKFPALYTRINHYLDWIGEEMMKFESKA